MTKSMTLPQLQKEILAEFDKKFEYGMCEREKVKSFLSHAIERAVEVGRGETLEPSDTSLEARVKALEKWQQKFIGFAKNDL